MNAMRSDSEPTKRVDPNFDKELQILMEIDSNSELTQRQLSQRVGIALGLTNTLLRNLVRKGYLRSQQASWRRWIYGLTPEGVSHKIYLTIQYVKRFLNQYKLIRERLGNELRPLALHEESRVAMVGTGEFAELVYLGLRDLGINEIDVFCQYAEPGYRFLGIPVQSVNRLDPKEFDQILISSLDPDFEGDFLKNLAMCGENRKTITFFSNGTKRNTPHE